MRGQCGKTSVFSPDLPCALEEVHADDPPSDDHLRRAVTSVCGTEYSEGPLCCTLDQVYNLRSNLEQAEPLVSACPACRNNFRGLFCAMTCGGNQSQYLDIVQTQQTGGGADGNLAVKQVSYWVGENWRDAFYNSCRDVKFGPGNAFAIDLLGGGAKDADALLKYLGDERPLIGSPFQIDFPRPHPSTFNTSDAIPFDPRPRNCDDPELLSRCACTDCPNTCAKLPYAEAPKHRDTCAIPLPGTQRRISCVTTAVVLLYILGLLLWWSGFRLGQIRGAKRAAIRHRNSGISVTSEGSGYERMRLGTEETPSEDEDQANRGLVGASTQDIDEDESTSSAGGLVATTGRGRGLLSSLGLGRSFRQPQGSSSSPSAAGAWALSASQPRSYPLGVRLGRLYYKLGRACASRPYLTFAIAAVVVGLANLGWLRFEMETDPVRLWVSPDSEARHRKAYFDEHFGPFYRTQQMFLMDSETAQLAGQRSYFASPDDWQDALLNNNQALSWQKLQWLADVEKTVRDMKTDNGTTLSDVCFAPYGPGGPCVVQSILGYFGDDLSSAGVDQTTWQDELNRCATKPAECLPAFGQPLKSNIVLGGIPNSQNPSEARSVISTWVLSNSLDNSQLLKAKDWEAALEQLLFSIAGVGSGPLHPLGRRREDLGITIHLSTEISLEQELSRAGKADVPIVVLSYLVMFLYVSLTLGGGASLTAEKQTSSRNRARPDGRSHRSGVLGNMVRLFDNRQPTSARRLLVHSKFSLGLFGIAVVLASVSAAVGVFSAMNVKVTLVIAEVLPFLLLAVGVDNVFLLADEMDRQNALTSTANPYALASSRSGLEDVDELLSSEDIEDTEYDGQYGAPQSDRVGPDSLFTVSAAERAARALSRVGPSILLSASVQVSAFLLGSTIPMPAVRHFALYAAASMAFAATLQCTVFVAAMALDAQRTENDRVDCLPCLKFSKSRRSGPSGSSDFSSLALGSTHGLSGEGLLGRIIRRSYAPTLIRPKSKKFVVALFGAVFALSCIGVRHIHMGLDQRLALPAGSYLRRYFDSVDTFLDVGPPVYFVARDVDVTHRQGQQAICGRFTTCNGLSLANTLEGERQRPESSFLAEPASSWLDDFFQWLNPTLESCCRVKKKDPNVFCGPNDSQFDCQPCFAEREPGWNITLDGMPEGDEFMYYLRQWLKSPTDSECPLGGQAAYSTSLVLDEGSNTVITSHFRTFHRPLRTQADFIDALRATERISNEITTANQGQKVDGLDVFAYAVYVPFFDQYLYLNRLAVQLLGGSLFAIIVVSAALLGSIRTAIIVAVCVSNAVFCVVAVMGALGITLNALTLVNLCVCAAISVEFCAHVARAFMRAPGSLPRHHALAQRERDDRAWAALVDVGPSVVSGITGTKLVGISVLFWAQSDILKLYYASLWFALILIGAVHGLVFLPVALSIFGGRGYASGDDEAEVSRRLRRAQDSAEFRPFAADMQGEESEEEYY